jgi:hypothetical protein
MPLDGSGKINEHGQETSEPSSYIAAYLRIIVDNF